MIAAKKKATVTDLRKELAQTRKDLEDALAFAPTPIRRCPKCKRIALPSGYICCNCGYDPS